ncbi:MAG TPA: VCBS repeat-containing protein [bacterium]|nr:VCBS repeat-containing protein [bacterium]
MPKDIPTPRFEKTVVEDNLSDGYWIQALDVNGNGRPDLVTSGLAEGHVAWYENPSWDKHAIATFPKPVSLDAADIDNDGNTDLVICHDYGNCMFNCGPEDGKISWLRNPGSFGNGDTWHTHFIGDRIATHRLKLGHFTQTDNLELLALPVVGPQGGPDAVHKPVRITLYTPPDDLLNASEWPEQVIDESRYRIIHHARVGDYPVQESAETDTLLIASEEGVSWFGYDGNGSWQQTVFDAGEVTQVDNTGFKGSGNVDVGRVGEDPCAYMAAVEPFHGNTVSVYTKMSDGTLTDARWKRTVLDVFGDPNDAGEGAGHHVITGDFDGDGDDEFLVALRGPWPWRGVYYYKAVDISDAMFVKKRISTESAARIAVADFTGDGRLDFATTGYYTPGYFLCENPQVAVFTNQIGS